MTRARPGFLVLGLLATATSAAPIIDNEPPLPSPCLSGVAVNTFAGPAAISLGSSALLSWSVMVPADCRVSLDINGVQVSRSFTMTVSPEFSTKYVLSVREGFRTRTLASRVVDVVLPNPLAIRRNDLQAQLIQALATEGQVIRLDDALDMDLSGKGFVSVASGVQLLGGRTPRTPGARLFTRTTPWGLLMIRGDHVRISGIRLVGAYPEEIPSDESNLSRAIVVESGIDVEVDHNEITGWPAVGVFVEDLSGRIDPVGNPHTVRVHDNFIHHNQFYGTFGYGVALGAGAYALIDQNVFDWNRHAIAATGKRGTGYHAQYNLVLEHGGYNRWWGWPYGWDRTHQFDQHGVDTCGITDLWSDTSYNCGEAGHSVDIRHNAFLYTEGYAFKLRGTPAVSPIGAYVVNNVFAHGSIGSALAQTETGLVQQNNQVGVNGMTELGTCDFDADGLQDRFLATGQSWWFSSGGGPWTFLRPSTLRRAQVVLGEFDARPGCDVGWGALFSSGGTAPWTTR